MPALELPFSLPKSWDLTVRKDRHGQDEVTLDLWGDGWTEAVGEWDLPEFSPARWETPPEIEGIDLVVAADTRDPAFLNAQPAQKVAIAMSQASPGLWKGNGGSVIGTSAGLWLLPNWPYRASLRFTINVAGAYKLVRLPRPVVSHPLTTDYRVKVVVEDHDDHYHVTAALLQRGNQIFDEPAVLTLTEFPVVLPTWARLTVAGVPADGETLPSDVDLTVAADRLSAEGVFPKGVLVPGNRYGVFVVCDHVGYPIAGCEFLRRPPAAD